jgi:hypothetical protein
LLIETDTDVVQIDEIQRRHIKTESVDICGGILHKASYKSSAVINTAAFQNSAYRPAKEKCDRNDNVRRNTNVANSFSFAIIPQIQNITEEAVGHRLCII